MFKEFWEKKKHVVETAGILTAIGALFLNINIPENELAKEALLNIQMLWLVIISIVSIILFLNFLLFAYKVEYRIENKISHELPYGFLSTFVFAIGAWFLINLWKYLLELYKQELRNFLAWLCLIPLGVAAFMVIYFEHKYTVLYLDKRKIKYYLVVSSVSFLAAIIYATLMDMLQIDFEWGASLTLFGMSFCITFLACLVLTYFGIRKIEKIEMYNKLQK